MDPTRWRSDEGVRRLRRDSRLRVARARKRRVVGASIFTALLVSSITFAGIERYQEWSEHQAILAARAEMARTAAICLAHASTRGAIKDSVYLSLERAFLANDTATMNQIRAQLAVRLEAEKRAALADNCAELYRGIVPVSGAGRDLSW